MTGLMQVMPYSFAANAMICFGGSLFYRLTVETNCAYKFSLPAFSGGLALLSVKAILATRPALNSLPMIGSGFVFLRYLSYIVLTVEYDVNEKLKLL